MVKLVNEESFRYVALNKSLEELGEITSQVVAGGQVQYQSLTTLKANCTITVKVKPDESFSLEGVRIYHTLNGSEECLGTFLIATPNSKIEKGVQTIECTGYSTLWRINNHAPKKKYYVGKGTNCIAEVKRILTSLGYEFSIPDYTGTTSTEREWELGDSYLTVINDLLEVVNFTSLYVDVMGVFKAEPYKLPQDRYIDKGLLEDDVNNILLPSLESELDKFNVPNLFMFSCSSDPDLDLYAVYENQEGETGTSNTWVNAYVEEVTDVADYDTLYALCKKKCAESTAIYNHVSFSTAIEMLPTYLPMVNLKLYQSEGSYEITSFTIHLTTGGKMDLEGRKVVVL